MEYLLLTKGLTMDYFKYYVSINPEVNKAFDSYTK